MKLRLLLVLFVLALGSVHGAEPPSRPAPGLPVLGGVFKLGTSTSVYLSLNSPDGATLQKGWVAVGETFAGFDVVSYSPETESLSLRRDQRTFTVSLAQRSIATLARDSAFERIASLIETEIQKLQSRPDYIPIDPTYEESLPYQDRQSIAQLRARAAQNGGSIFIFRDINTWGMLAVPPLPPGMLQKQFAAIGENLTEADWAELTDKLNAYVADKSRVDSLRRRQKS